jgi:hypothetical protein
MNFLSLLFDKRKVPEPKSRYFICLKVYHTLISTSTPLGNSSFINASIVFDEDE